MFKIKSSLTIFLLLVFPVSFNVAAQNKQCIQILEQNSDLVNLNVTVINANEFDNLAISPYTPTIPPNGLFSPDNKFSVFWQMVSKTEVGLYFGSIDTGEIALLTKRQYKYGDLWKDPQHPLASWSSSSKYLAYISQEDDRFFLNVLRVSDVTKSRKEIVPPDGSSIEYVSINGWSADSEYFSLTIQFQEEIEGLRFNGEIAVWKAADLSIVLSGARIVASGDFNVGLPIAWSPIGHKLAMLLWEKPSESIGSINIWSPEDGFEITVTEKNIYTTDFWPRLAWSPDAQFIHLRTSVTGAHTSWDGIYFFKERTLIKDIPSPTSLGYRLIGWLPTRGALVINTTYVDKPKNQTTTLLIISPNGEHSIVANSVTQVAISPDAKHIGYLVEDTNSHKVVLSASDGTQQQTLFSNEPSKPTLEQQTDNILWSPDGNYVTVDWNTTKHIVQSVDGKRRWELDNVEFPIYGRWVENHWLIYAINVDSKSHLEFFNLDDGKRISTRDGNLSFFDATLSPDKGFAAIAFREFILIVPLDKAVSKATKFNLTGYDWWFSHTMYYKFYDKYYNLRWNKYALAWSPDSSKLAFIDAVDKLDKKEIVVISNEGIELHRSSLNVEIDMTQPISIQWTPCRLIVGSGK